MRTHACRVDRQADEAFPDAFILDEGMTNVDLNIVSSMYTRSKVYHSPIVWYVRVCIIEVQDLVSAEKTQFPDHVYVKAQIRNQVSRTRPDQVRATNALWNEDFMFVAAEPFEDDLILTIEDGLGPGEVDILGKVVIPLKSVQRRSDDRIVDSRWFDHQDPSDHEIDEKKNKKDKFATHLHLCVCLDGGYHVFDESTQYSSDLRPTSKELWKPSIGILELSILNASALQPMKIRDGKGTIDAYCVAKYRHKWVRTRTVVDNLAPQFNEQYTWEVYGPSTILTVGDFDNTQLEDGNSNNVWVRKIRIRISTLETDGRVYNHSYPLLILDQTGVKKMGELRLSVRFSSTSMMNMKSTYSKPLLPKMHYVRPLTFTQLEVLRHQATEIVSARLSRAEMPLGREIVEYMTDGNKHLWSMRRSKTYFFRLMLVFNGVLAVCIWFRDVCLWKNRFRTVFAHLLLAMLLIFPEYIIELFALYIFELGVWNHCIREQCRSYMNTRLLYTERVDPDELDKEFDTFPTSRSQELVRHRYDQLQSVFGRIHAVVGDILSREERQWLQGLVVLFCLVGAPFVSYVVPYEVPFQVVVIVGGLFYVMRHPLHPEFLPEVSSWH